MTPIEVVRAFAERISADDADGLCDLMTEDHVFIDAMDTTVQGREVMRKGWRGYFAMVPDYSIQIEQIFSAGDTVGAFGRAGGTYSSDGTLKPENRWEVPAAWLAVVRDEKVALWRVYTDNEPIRQIMAREKGGK